MRTGKPNPLFRRAVPGAAFAGAVLADALVAPGKAMADLPMTYLRTFGGDKGEQITTLTWALLIQSIIVVVITSALVLAGILWRRSRARTVGRQAVERAGSGLGWIYIGVGLSTIALLVSMVWNGYTLAAIDQPPREPSLTIEVRGHQWWWEVRYLDDDVSRIFVTANEIHIPTGQPVRFRLSTADVIHSFWVPALGGKVDLIPNQVNTTWLEAGEPGIYRGQCAEYCGLQHAHMAMLVVAQEPEAFQDWWNAQLRPAPEPGRPELAAAQDQFVLRCGACHAVRGTRAGGRLGPDLSHLMSRRTIAAGTLPNTAGHLAGWISDPQTAKPGALMPVLDLSGPELASIRSYLETLK